MKPDSKILSLPCVHAVQCHRGDTITFKTPGLDIRPSEVEVMSAALRTFDALDRARPGKPLELRNRDLYADMSVSYGEISLRVVGSGLFRIVLWVKPGSDTRSLARSLRRALELEIGAGS